MGEKQESTEFKGKAISYVRFSSSKQELGASYARQTNLCEEYCRRNHLELDPKYYEDLGVSGWTGENATEGALSKLIENVESGKIEKGTWLIVESLDRLGRQEVRRAMELFLSLLRLGLNIVTIKDNQVYLHDAHPDRKDKDSEMNEILISVMVMSRAREESDNKSKNVRDGLKNRKKQASETKRVITSNVPHWLKVEGVGDNRKIVVIPERVKVVKEIFRLSNEEDHGASIIAKTLQANGVPIWSPKRNVKGAWTIGYINSILSNVSVLGIYEDKDTTIPSYYPKIISLKDFDLAQVKKVTRSKRKAGRTPTRGKTSNILSGVVKCTCGASLHYTTCNRGTNLWEYLTCAARCGMPNIRYQDVEAAVILNVPEVDWTSIREGQMNKREQQEIQNEATGMKIATLQKKLEDLETLIIEDPSKILAQAIAKVERNMEELAKQILPFEEIDHDDFSAVTEAMKAMGKEGGIKDPDARRRFAKAIRTNLKRITVFTPETSRRKYKSIAIELLCADDSQIFIYSVVAEKKAYTWRVKGEAKLAEWVEKKAYAFSTLPLEVQSHLISSKIHKSMTMIYSIANA